MKKSKFTPTQITKILGEYDSGKPSLEEENARLKRMYAELALDHQMAREIIEKKL